MFKPKIKFPGKKNASPWFLFVFFSLGVFLCGCENHGEKGPENQGHREAVSIAIPHTPPNWLTILALEKGFFADEGLDATPKYYPSGKRALEGMLAGDVDIAASADVPMVFQSFKGQDFQIFAVIGASKDDNQIVARKDFGITKPADLKGKRVASQKGAAAHFFQHLFLLKNGMDDTDVENFFLKVEELPQALIRGEVDAITTREPFLSQSLEALKENAVVFSEPGLYTKIFALAASSSVIKEKPGAIQKILRAMIRAEDFFLEEPDQARKIICQKTGLPESQFALELPNLDLRVSLNQSLLRILGDEARWAMANGLTDAQNVPNYLNFIYLDALEKVNFRRVGIIR